MVGRALLLFPWRIIFHRRPYLFDCPKSMGADLDRLGGMRSHAGRRNILIADFVVANGIESNICRKLGTRTRLAARKYRPVEIPV